MHCPKCNKATGSQVIQALETRCCVCHEPAGVYCHNICDLGKPLPMGRLVHVGRATKEKT